MNKNEASWIELANEVSIFGKTILNSLAVNNENGVQILTSILFRRLVFGLDAVRILVENTLYTESRILRRGMLEALFSLGALWKQPDTVSNFVNNDVHRRIKLYTNIKKTSKKFREKHLNRISDKEVEEILSDLRSQKQGEYLSTESLSQKAELHDLYLSDYAILSESAHHLAKDLERHISADKGNNIRELLVEDKETSGKDLLFPAIDHMLMACDAIDNIFGEKHEMQIQGFSKRVNELRQNHE